MGKLEKKAAFSPCCGDETIAYMTEPFHAKGKALPQQMIAVFSEKPKRQPIKRLTHEVAYSRLKNGKLKKHIVTLLRDKTKGSVIAYGCFISAVC